MSVTIVRTGACLGRRSLVLLAAALIAVALTSASAFGQAVPAHVTWEETIEVASGGGYRGPWRMNRSEFRYIDDPTVAIDARGLVGVAWADQSRQDIFFQIYEPDGRARFEAPVNVSRSPEIFSWLPRMVIASGDTNHVYLLWQEIVFSGGSHGGEILFARSSDGGKTFDDPVNLSNSIAGDGKGRLTRRHWHNGSLDLVQGPRGDLYAAWSEYEGTLWFSRSTDGGRSFSEPLRIAGGQNAKPARGPSLAVAAGGTVYLAWTVGEDKAGDIHLAKSGDHGKSFDAPRVVFDSDGHSDAPKIAVDSEGTLHLVYAESPSGPFGGYHIVYTRSRDGARSFETPREISGPQTQRFESVSFPALSLDGADNLYVIWELFPSRATYPRGLGFTSSRDGGQSFAPPSVIPGSGDPALGVNGSQQGLLMRKLAVNGTSALAVVNSTFKRNQSSRIWLFRGQAQTR
ncbi:sialidase family protein [Pelagibius sp.]|uniref:sialidase family protein n=1 Tax=Pelagibius sp. TaxID=1931238 RepID=UPI00261ACD96|nr:sialidase family protein [Pelagibius sp.]